MNSVIATPYNGLLFSISGMLQEIEWMRKLCQTFIEIQSFESIIPAWKKSLEGLKQSANGQPLSWEISLTRPIRTKQSAGDYQMDGQGAHTVVGELACKWEIVHLASIQENGISHKSCFLLNGIGSTSISVANINAEIGKQTIAHWTFDVGSNNSPGCHFHNHVKGSTEDRHFSGGLDIPRFPTYLVTPMDALDFLLGELFQKKWVEHVAKSSTSGWPGLQKKRIKKTLEWHNHVLDDVVAGSSWTALKASKPARHVLL